MRVFIFGAGYSGRAIARALSGEAEWIGGTTRRAETMARLEAAGIAPFRFDGAAAGFGPDLERALSGVTHLVQSIAPGEAGDPVLAALGDDLARRLPSLSWIGYLSTVGVYGDHGGAWVDEATPCRPVSARSKARLAAEEAWTDAGRAAGVPVAVIRLSGIYGPGRNGFVNLAKGAARRLIKPGQVFNRIHVEDIAGASRLLARRRAGGIFNVTDDEPAPPQDVVAFAAATMGVEPPPETAFETAELSAMARSFYGENKRVSNARIKQAGYRFVYPHYRHALTKMWAEDLWRPTE